MGTFPRIEPPFSDQTNVLHGGPMFCTVALTPKVREARPWAKLYNPFGVKTKIMFPAGGAYTQGARSATLGYAVQPLRGKNQKPNTKHQLHSLDHDTRSFHFDHLDWRVHRNEVPFCYHVHIPFAELRHPRRAKH